MSETACDRKRFIIILVLLAMTMLCPSAEANSPVIIRHDAHLMESGVRINIAWQSDEPIVRIIASAGREQVVIEKDIDNERNEGGYSGVIDIVVPAYLYNVSGEQTMYMNRQSSNQFQQSSMEMYSNSTSPYNEAVQYTIQLVDEINQRSTLLKDKVRRLEPSHPQAGQRPQPKSTTAAVAIDMKDPLNSALNATIGLIGKIGQTPEIKNAKVQNWTENRITIIFEASGGKGIDRVVYEVRDSHGDIAYQNSILCNSEKLCTKQTDPFALSTGKYTLSIMAADIENNNSKRVEQEFQVQGTTSAVQQPVQPSSSQMLQQNIQQPSPSPSQTSPPDVTYENQ